MNARKVVRACVVVGLLLATTAVAVHHDLHRDPARHSVLGIPEDPPWVPVVGQVDAGPVPSAPPPTPDLVQIDAVARFSHTRVGAEKFALLVASLVTDTRAGDPAPDSVAAFLSPHMTAPVRSFLLFDAKGQRRAGTERHYDPALDLWLRSAVIGPATAPRRVDVEVAGNLVSRPLGLRSWYRDRFDVTWESGRWWLVNYSAGLFGPDSSRNLTTAEQRTFLTGAGWRRIPAA